MCAFDKIRWCAFSSEMANVEIIRHFIEINYKIVENNRVTVEIIYKTVEINPLFVEMNVQHAKIKSIRCQDGP